MPHPETRHRKQYALLWTFSGVDRYGQTKVSAPVEVLVRWETGRADMLDMMGNKVNVDARLVVDQDIDIGSAMWLGTEAEWLSGTGSGGEDDEVMQVAVFNKAPNVKGNRYRREVGLVKYKDGPPELG